MTGRRTFLATVGCFAVTTAIGAKPQPTPVEPIEIWLRVQSLSPVGETPRRYLVTNSRIALTSKQAWRELKSGREQFALVRLPNGGWRR